MDIEQLKELRDRVAASPRFAPQVLAERMFLAAPLVLPSDTVDEALNISADLNTLRQDLITALDQYIDERCGKPASQFQVGQVVRVKNVLNSCGLPLTGKINWFGQQESYTLVNLDLGGQGLPFCTTLDNIVPVVAE